MKRMKKWMLFAAMCLLSMTASAKDGKGTSNLNVAFLPFGNMEVKMAHNKKKEDGSYRFYYKDLVGGSLAYEYKMDKWRVMPEFSYYTAKYDEFTTEDKATFLDNWIYDKSGNIQPTAEDNINIFKFMIWLGYTIKLDPNNRFQLPIYFGAGYAAISGSDITKYAGIDFGLRVRLKGYITNTFGLFAGYTVDWALGEGNKDFKFDVNNLANFSYPEVGVTFSF
jgi:hypothetical protein